MRHWYRSSSTSSIEGHENYNCCAELLLPIRYASQKMTKFHPTKHESLVLTILLYRTDKNNMISIWEHKLFHDQSQKIQQSSSRKSLKINFDKAERKVWCDAKPMTKKQKKSYDKWRKIISIGEPKWRKTNYLSAYSWIAEREGV